MNSNKTTSTNEVPPTNKKSLVFELFLKLISSLWEHRTKKENKVESKPYENMYQIQDLDSVMPPISLSLVLSKSPSNTENILKNILLMLITSQHLNDEKF